MKLKPTNNNILTVTICQKSKWKIQMFLSPLIYLLYNMVGLKGVFIECQQRHSNLKGIFGINNLLKEHPVVASARLNMSQRSSNWPWIIASKYGLRSIFYMWGYHIYLFNFEALGAQPKYTKGFFLSVYKAECLFNG